MGDWWCVCCRLSRVCRAIRVGKRSRFRPRSDVYATWELGDHPVDRLVDERGLLGAIVGRLGVVNNRQWRTCGNITAVVLHELASTNVAV